MTRTITVWQIDREGSDEMLLADTLSELETAFNFIDNSPQVFIITRLEMTQEEYDALDDFGGF